MSHGDIWAVSPSTSATYYRAAAAIAGAGVLPLIRYDAGPEGVGYKVLITSAGDDSGDTFTIVGYKVGALDSGPTAEVVTGPNATTASSVNFYATIVNITASGASAGDVSIGTTGSLALPRTRLKAAYYVGTASAGTIVVTVNSTTGSTVLSVNTPASATVATHMDLPGAGLLTTRSGKDDFAIVTLTNVTYATLFCG